MNMIEYTTLQDVIKSIEISFSPKGTELNDDSSITETILMNLNELSKNVIMKEMKKWNLIIGLFKFILIMKQCLIKILRWMIFITL